MKIILSVALTSLFTFIYGQKDPAAEQYLDKISDDLSPEYAIHINFEYLREDLQAETELAGKGLLVLLNEKYRMELDEVVVYFDGEKQYSLNKEIEEVYISLPDPENKEFMFSDPIRLLRNYKSEFKYRLMGESTFKGEKATEIQLYPEELGGPYALLKLFFSFENDNLKAITVRQKDGIIYTMQIIKLEKRDDPGIEYFRFSSDEFPNVDIIELLD